MLLILTSFIVTDMPHLQVLPQLAEDILVSNTTSLLLMVLPVLPVLLMVLPVLVLHMVLLAPHLADTQVNMHRAVIPDKILKGTVHHPALHLRMYHSYYFRIGHI